MDSCPQLIRSTLLACWLVIPACCSERQNSSATDNDVQPPPLEHAPQVRHPEYELPTEIDAALYWRAKSLRLLRKETETDDEITGEFQDVHGFRPFTIKKAALSDEVARTRGTVDALRRVVLTLVELGDEVSQYSEEVRQIGKSLTGLELESATTWRTWFDENRYFLYWSEDEGRLAIDREAKAASVPVLDYRRIHKSSEQQ